MLLLFTIGAIGLSHVQTNYELQQLEKENQRLKILHSPISDHDISNRLAGELEKLGVSRISDLTEMTEDDFFKSPTFGEASRQEIRELKTKLGL